MIKGWRLKAETQTGDPHLIDSIWEFTPGILLKSWLSDKASNLETLVEKGRGFDLGLKHNNNTMTLAVPRYAHNIGFKVGQQIGRFAINFHEGSKMQPSKSILFNNVEVRNAITRDFSRVPQVPTDDPNYREVLLMFESVDFS